MHYRVDMVIEYAQSGWNVVQSIKYLPTKYVKNHLNKYYLKVTI